MPSLLEAMAQSPFYRPYSSAAEPSPSPIPLHITATLESLGIRPLPGSEDVPLPRFAQSTRPSSRIPPMSLHDAVKFIKTSRRLKFDATIDIAINLGIDPRRGDQMVRGAISLPHGSGKSVKVAVFARGEAADEGREAGADAVGAEELVSRVQETAGGCLQDTRLGNYKCIATPDMMPLLGKVAKILGPKGMMPNPKVGTVTNNVSQAVRMLKAGRVEFRAEKGGIIHAGIGKCSFPEEHVTANITALVNALLAAKPKGLKGGNNSYILKATLSSTMGPGVEILLPSLFAAAQKPSLP